MHENACDNSNRRLQVLLLQRQSNAHLGNPTTEVGVKTQGTIEGSTKKIDIARTGEDIEVALPQLKQTGQNDIEETMITASLDIDIGIVTANGVVTMTASHQKRTMKTEGGNIPGGDGINHTQSPEAIRRAGTEALIAIAIDDKAAALTIIHARIHASENTTNPVRRDMQIHRLVVHVLNPPLDVTALHLLQRCQLRQARNQIPSKNSWDLFPRAKTRLPSAPEEEAPTNPT